MTGSDALIYRLIFNLTENAVKYNRAGRLGTGFCHSGVGKAPAPRLRHRLRHPGGVSAQYLPALLPGGQVSQPGIRRRRTGALTGMGDRRPPRRLCLGGEKFGEGHDHRGGAAGRGERFLRRGYPIIVLGGFMMIVFQPPQCYRSSSRSAPCRG